MPLSPSHLPYSNTHARPPTHIIAEPLQTCRTSTSVLATAQVKPAALPATGKPSETSPKSNNHVTFHVS